jgi:hypothetical protein
MPMPSARSPIEYLSCQMTTVVLAAMLFYAAGARAGDPVARSYSFSGFGTVGLVHSIGDQADYTNSPWYKPSGASHSNINKRATTPMLAGKECLIGVEALLVDFSG